jgi:mono/diheme cytochrome c family protein
MEEKSISTVSRKAGRRRLHVRSMMPTFTLLLTVLFSAGMAASREIPPEVEKKAVSLAESNTEAERLFNSRCGSCHKLPDAANSEAKSACIHGFTKEDLARTRHYMADVRAGKGLYESYCGRCHALIDPASHTFDYWSKNICTSDSCMVKRRLTRDEEQKLLLYLSSHAGKSLHDAKK